MTAPRAFCWLTKYVPLKPASFLATVSISPTMQRVNTVSGIFKISMLTNTLTTVMAEFASCGMLWLIICRSVSTSLV